MARAAGPAAPATVPQTRAEATGRATRAGSDGQVVVISGLSGAGKSQASKLFEDLGYYCVDNLPPDLLDRFLALRDEDPGRFRNVALVLDIRAGDPAPAVVTPPPPPEPVLDPLSGHLYDPRGPRPTCAKWVWSIDGSLGDPWGFVWRNCTSFVAWRMQERNGMAGFSNSFGGQHWGNAEHWDDAARALGYRVEKAPAAADLAEEAATTTARFKLPLEVVLALVSGAASGV